MSNEPYYEQYAATLSRIDSIIGPIRIEGSLFYRHGDRKRKELFPAFYSKRQTFANLALDCDVMVEIGFNAGHSALLALTANPNLIYRGIDICIHPYTRPCFDLLKSEFGDRIDLLPGSSHNMIPKVHSIYPDIQLQKIAWVIDGSHDPVDADLDIQNVLACAKPSDVIFVDDINLPGLRDAVMHYSNQIKIVELTETFAIIQKA